MPATPEPLTVRPRGFVFLVLLMLAAGPAGAQTAAEPRRPDLEAGARSFNKCRSCHQIGEGAQNQIGPVLNGVVGRRAGSYPGYAYSAANRGSGLGWDEATLREYLHDPKALVPGTKMMFAGIRTDREIDDLLAFVKLFDAAGRRAAPP